MSKKYLNNKPIQILIASPEGNIVPQKTIQFEGCYRPASIPVVNHLGRYTGFGQGIAFDFAKWEAHTLHAIHQWRAALQALGRKALPVEASGLPTTFRFICLRFVSADIAGQRQETGLSPSGGGK